MTKLTNRAEVEKFLSENSIRGYAMTLDQNGDVEHVDVDGNVDLQDLKLKEIPVKFNKVTGYFDCSRNQLKSLSGAPRDVGKDFYCHENPLTEMADLPKGLGGDLWMAQAWIGGLNVLKISVWSSDPLLVCDHEQPLLFVSFTGFAKLELPKGPDKLLFILNKHLQGKREDTHDCEKELRASGFHEQAEIRRDPNA